MKMILELIAITIAYLMPLVLFFKLKAKRKYPQENRAKNGQFLRKVKVGGMIPGYFYL